MARRRASLSLTWTATTTTATAAKEFAVECGAMKRELIGVPVQSKRKKVPCHFAGESHV